MCLPTQGTPPPQHSRLDPQRTQRTQHTASTAATPRYPQGRRQYPCRRAGPTQSVYALSAPLAGAARAGGWRRLLRGSGRRLCGPVPVHTQTSRTATLHVEYAERGRKYGVLFIFNLFCEYIDLEYVRVPVVYRVNQVEYGIHIRVVASQEYVNTYSTRKTATYMAGLSAPLAGAALAGDWRRLLHGRRPCGPGPAGRRVQNRAPDRVGSLRPW